MEAQLAQPFGREISEQTWARLRAHADPEEASDVLLRYQRRLLESTSLHQITICEKSRRTGMTWAAAADAVLTAGATKAAGGMDALYMGYNLDMAREFIDTSAMWAEALGEAMSETGLESFLFDDDGQPIQAFRIRFASGHEIRALSAKPRSLRGLQGYLILDEAAFHDDLQGGGRCGCAVSHVGRQDPHHQHALRRREHVQSAGRRRPAPSASPTMWCASPWTTPSWMAFTGASARSETSPGRQRVRRSGGRISSWRRATPPMRSFSASPHRGGGAVLNGALIEARMAPGIPVFRLEKPASFGLQPAEVRRSDIDQWCRAVLEPVLAAMDPTVTSCLGGDFGRIADLTVFWPLTLARNLQRLTPFVVELRNIPFEQQFQIGAFICDRLPRFSSAKFDAIGIGAQLAESFAQRYGGWRVDQVKLSATWYVEHVPPFRAAFEDGGISIPRDVDIKKDLQLPVMRGGIPTIPPIRTTGMDGKKRHGDAFVAALLAHAASCDLRGDARIDPIGMPSAAVSALDGFAFEATEAVDISDFLRM